MEPWLNESIFIKLYRSRTHSHISKWCPGTRIVRNKFTTEFFFLLCSFSRISIFRLIMTRVWRTRARTASIKSNFIVNNKILLFSSIRHSLFRCKEAESETPFLVNGGLISDLPIHRRSLLLCLCHYPGVYNSKSKYLGILL